MNPWVASTGLMLLLGRPVEAQRGGDGSYTVSGFIVSQHETSDSQFEIRLLTDSDRELAVIEKRIQEPFTFSGLERGYYKASLLDKAESSLIHALELDPALSTARLALVNVYIRAQDWERALAQIDR